MRAGDKVIWIDEGHGGVERRCEIVAILKIDDALNKNVVGKTVCRLDYCNLEVFADELEVVVSGSENEVESKDNMGEKWGSEGIHTCSNCKIVFKVYTPDNKKKVMSYCPNCAYTLGADISEDDEE